MTIAIIRAPSPNHSARLPGIGISAIVLHADAGMSDAGTVSWIQSPDSRVSYHYLIGRTGKVWQFVDDHEKAWHAGVSVFKGRKFCNDYTLGIAFANNQKGEAFTAAQLAVGVELVADKCAHYEIELDDVTTHAVVSPGRKTDPGPLFDMPAFLARVEAALG